MTRETKTTSLVEVDQAEILEHQRRYCPIDLLKQFPELLERDAPIVATGTIGIVDVSGFTLWQTAEAPIPRRGGQMYVEYLAALQGVFAEHNIAMAGVKGDEASGVGRISFTSGVKLALQAQKAFLDVASDYGDVKSVIELEEDIGVHVGINFPRADDPEPLLFRKVDLGSKSEIGMFGPKTSVKRLKHPKGVVVTASESHPTLEDNGWESNGPDVIVSGLASQQQLEALQAAGLLVHSYRDPAYPETIYTLHAIEVPHDVHVSDVLKELESMDAKEPNHSTAYNPNSASPSITIDRQRLASFARRAGPLFQHGDHFLPRPIHAEEGFNVRAGDAAFPFIGGFREFRASLLERHGELIQNPDVSQLEIERTALLLTTETEALTAETLAGELGKRGWPVKELEDNNFLLLLPATHNVEALDADAPGRLTTPALNPLVESMGKLQSQRFKRDIIEMLTVNLDNICPTAVNVGALKDIVEKDLELKTSVGIMSAGFGEPRISWGIEEPEKAEFWQFALFGSAMTLAARSGAFALFKGYRQRLQELQETRQQSPEQRSETTNLERLDQIMQSGSVLVMPHIVAEEMNLVSRNSVTLHDVHFKGVSTPWDLVIAPIEPRE